MKRGMHKIKRDVVYLCTCVPVYLCTCVPVYLCFCSHKKSQKKNNSPKKNGRVVGRIWASCRVVLTRRAPMPRGGGGGGRGYDSSHFLRTENSFGIIWSSPRQLRVKNTLRVGHRGPVGRKTTQKPPQNTKKWKKIVKKRLFSRFGHFGQNSDFSRKKSKTGIFFDITKPPLAQIYPKSGL